MSEDTKPQYSAGDQVTISRGKLRGQEAKVIAVNEIGKKYAVQTSDDVTVVSFGAVKPKQERTVTESQIREVVEQMKIMFGEDPADFVQDNLLS